MIFLEIGREPYQRFGATAFVELLRTKCVEVTIAVNRPSSLVTLVSTVTDVRPQEILWIPRGWFHAVCS